MDREIIKTTAAPAAVGPYSQAVRVGDLVFTAGQIGIDPQTGDMAEGLEAQTRQVLSNLKAVLTAAGSSVDGVVKTTVYLQNMADFTAMNAIYGEVFASAPPARSTVQAAGLPLGALVEVEAIALCEK
ncbi:MAG: RidA family protein [Chloroflexota bacterium]|nr:RidA family protein [Chloroflexota bacterium]